MSRCSNVNQLWNEICVILDLCVHEYVPLRKLNARSMPKYPKYIRKLISRKKVAYKRDRPNFRKISKIYEKAVKAFHTKRESDIVARGDVRQFYTYVNSKLRCKTAIPTLKLSDGSFITDNREKCRAFNDYFGSVFTRDDGNLPVFSRNVSNAVGLNSVLFPYEKVVRVLQNLPSKISQSPDGYPALFLKMISKEIAIPFCNLFELSMKSGKLPEIWKTAKVCPVYKKGLHSVPANYRPVSLTCILCKVMEGVISDSMLSYLKEYKLITDN